MSQSPQLDNNERKFEDSYVEFLKPIGTFNNDISSY